MEMKQTELEGGVLKVDLAGSFDIAGSGDVDLRFSLIGGKRDKVIVDFTKVTFLASIGIRVLVKAAKAMANRGGKMVVLNPNEAARRVLKSTGVDSVIPVVATEAEAVAALR